MVWYIDTSAFLKLVVLEPESPVLRSWLIDSGPCWSSQVLRTEALRAGERLGVAEAVVVEALEAVSLVTPGPSTFRAAGRLRPSALRSLGALHLATALELGDVTYDARMIDAAGMASMVVVSPT
jgi:predicted nucleic acid-binding protein